MSTKREEKEQPQEIKNLSWILRNEQNNSSQLER